MKKSEHKIEFYRQLLTITTAFLAGDIAWLVSNRSVSDRYLLLIAALTGMLLFAIGQALIADISKKINDLEE